MQPHFGKARPTWLTTGYDVPQETKRPRELSSARPTDMRDVPADHQRGMATLSPDRTQARARDAAAIPRPWVLPGAPS
jgi:hypothetical protein